MHECKWTEVCIIMREVSVNPMDILDMVLEGQIFWLMPNGEIVPERCWMASCISHYHEFSYMVPLTPRHEDRMTFLARRHDCRVDTEIFLQQRGVFEAVDTKVKEFLEDLLEFEPKTDRGTVLEMIGSSVTGGLCDRDDELDQATQHFYLMPYRDRILYLEFEDNSYRPEIYSTPKLTAQYSDLIESMRQWALAKEEWVEKLFDGIKDPMIDALNEGFDQLSVEKRNDLMGANRKANLFWSIQEIHPMPTVWVCPSGELYWTHDLGAKWRSSFDGCQASLGEFKFCHNLNHGKMARIIHAPEFAAS